MDVLDFEAEITAVDHGVYEVTLRGPDGAETTARTRLPLLPEQLRTLVARIPDAVLASSARVRRSASPEEQPVQVLGHTLFGMLTAGDGRALLAAARHTAARAETQLRMVLRVRPPELASLPWEFLFDEAHSGYVCTTTPLIRRPQISLPQRPLRVEPPLRVLCMIARPGNQQPLAVEAERRRLAAALEELRLDGLIELAWVDGGTWRELKGALRPGRGPWHVLHFIGHGSFDRMAGEGALALDDGSGGTYHLGAENLAMVLQGHPSLRLVVLNACETGRASSADPFSSVGGALMRAGLSAALVMQYPISDHAAVEFSQSFYEELAQGRSVDAAVTDARQSVRLALPGTLEWGTPVLYMRSLDGVLFAIDGQRRPGAARATQAGELYVQGLAALYTHRWDDAVAVFRAVLAKDGGHEQASVKLEEALRGRRLDHLYTAAVGAAEAGHWDDAVAHLGTILEEDPEYRDAPERWEVARTRSQVAALRAEARALHAAGQWEAVAAVGERLAALAPEEADPDGMVAEARSRTDPRTVRALTADAPERAGDGQLGAGRSGAGRSGPGESGAGRSGAGESGAGQPGAGEPDGGVPGAGEPDGGVPGAGEPRAGQPGAGEPDGGVPDTGRALRLRTSMETWSVRFAPDGARVIAGGAYGDVGMFDLRGQRQEQPDAGWLKVVPSSVLFAALPFVVGATAMWKRRRPEKGFGSGPSRALALSPDGRRVATGLGVTVLLRSAEGARAVEFAVGRHDVTALAFCRDDLLAAASHHTVGLWSLDRPIRLHTLDHEDAVYALAVSRAATRLATAGHSTIRVWDIDTGEQSLSIAYHPMVFAADFSPDGDRLVTGALDHTARVWDVVTGACLTRIDLPDRVRGVAFGPHGDTLAIASGRAVTLLDLSTRRTILELDGDFGDVSLLQIAYSPDGTHLATVGGGKAWLIPVPKERHV